MSRIRLNSSYDSPAVRTNAKMWASKFRSNFIEPGLVRFVINGDEIISYLSKATIDKALKTLEGKPLTVKHHLPNGEQVKPDTMKSHGHGYVANAYYNAQTGWYDCDGVCDTDEARAAIQRGGKVSCKYNVKRTGPGGMWHNMPYDEELTEIEFEHLAIVDKPRYEGAEIRLNSKTNHITNMTLNPFKWFKKDATTANGEIAPDTVVELGDGKTVRLNDAIESYRKKTAAAEQRDNAAEVDENAEFEIDGKRVTLGAILEAHNSVEEPKKEAAKEQKQEEAAKEQKQEEAKPESKENSVEAKPAAVTKKPAFVNVLRMARTQGRENAAANQPIRSPDTAAQREARGQERYGSIKVAKN